MNVRKRRRTAWATGLSLVLHVLFLGGMVLGVRVVTPPEGDRPMEVRLIAPPERPPRPQLLRQAPEPRPTALAPLHPHLAPSPSLSVPTGPVVDAAPTPAPSKPVYGPQGMQPSLSGRLGCDDPLTFHLTPEQRQTCYNHMAELLKEAKPLGLNISDRKKGDYDRAVHCFNTYTRGGVPPSDSHDDSSPIAGLGYVPTFKECPPGDR